MSTVFDLLTIINFFGICYLIFIFYKKNSSKNKVNIPELTANKTKINLTRFNPFDDLGGDQSFILSILDNTNSGAIITSLHNRDITRIYAKSIKNGEGVDTTLSKEEKAALLKAIKN